MYSTYYYIIPHATTILYYILLVYNVQYILLHNNTCYYNTILTIINTTFWSDLLLKINGWYIFCLKLKSLWFANFWKNNCLQQNNFFIIYLGKNKKIQITFWIYWIQRKEKSACNRSLYLSLDLYSTLRFRGNFDLTGFKFKVWGCQLRRGGWEGAENIYVAGTGVVRCEGCLLKSHWTFFHWVSESPLANRCDILRHLTDTLGFVITWKPAWPPKKDTLSGVKTNPGSI